MNELKTVWQQIDVTRNISGRYGGDFPMNAPATIDKIEQRLSRALGCAMPLQLQVSLQIHDGMDSDRGVWRNSLIPLSIESIIKRWQSDRRREKEALNEGCEPVKLEHQIPIMADPTAHHEIYLDARNGSVLNYVVDGLYFHPFQYACYLDFLVAIRDCPELDGHFEWPQQEQPG